MQLDVDKIDIEILYLLHLEDKVSPLHSWQIKIFVDNCKTKLSYNTMVRRLQKLYDKGLLSMGYKERNAITYFLSEKGINFIENDIIEDENENYNNNHEEEIII